MYHWARERLVWSKNGGLHFWTEEERKMEDWKKKIEKWKWRRSESKDENDPLRIIWWPRLMKSIGKLVRIHLKWPVRKVRPSTSQFCYRNLLQIFFVNLNASKTYDYIARARYLVHDVLYIPVDDGYLRWFIGDRFEMLVTDLRYRRAIIYKSLTRVSVILYQGHWPGHQRNDSATSIAKLSPSDPHCSRLQLRHESCRMSQR